MQEKKTIYFLQWLSKESGFTENQILENMKPENQGWDDINYNSIEEFLEKENDSRYWFTNLFLWENSFLKPNISFWNRIDNKLDTLLYSNEYNIVFSKYLIKNWKIVKKIKETKEVKLIKNLKI